MSWFYGKSEEGAKSPREEKKEKKKKKKEEEEQQDEWDLDYLLDKNRAKIATLQELCEDIIDPSVHDEVFLLRYVLSHKSAEKAAPALRKGLEYRAENSSWLSAAKTGGEAPHAKRIERYTCVGLHKNNIDGGAVMVIRAGLTPAPQLMETVSVAELTEWFMFKKEQTFLICDEATRRTRRLVKTLVLNDATGVPGMWELMKMVNNGGLMQALGDSSKLSENVYPQLVSRSVIMNAPGFVKMVFKVARVFMSARMMEKVKLCSGDIVDGDINTCPWASRLIPIKDIPSFLGGECNCPGGCVANVPNEQTTKKGLEDEDEQEEDEGEDGEAAGAEDDTPTKKSKKKKKKKK